MDNASKALIMAGAILVAIGIVGVGVFMFSSTSSINSMGQQQLDATAAQLANSNLRQYAGNRTKGAIVTEFLSYIDVLNANQTFPADIQVASSKFDNSVNGKLVKASDSIESNSYYTVILNDGNGDGYYDKVQITKNAGALGDLAGSGDSGDITDLTDFDDEISGDEVSGEIDTTLESGEVSLSGEVVNTEETNSSEVASGELN